jgi:hypothetical protein
MIDDVELTHKIEEVEEPAGDRLFRLHGFKILILISCVAVTIFEVTK